MNSRYIIPSVKAIELAGECLMQGSMPARAQMHESYTEDTESSQQTSQPNSITWGGWQ